MRSANRKAAMNKAYVHGYDDRENQRLQDQAQTLVDLLHSDTAYPSGSRVLEAGCGVGGNRGRCAAPMAGSPPRPVDTTDDSYDIRQTNATP